jgi:hypothetical protein
MISTMQVFGYSIALGGMLWFKLGPEKLKEVLSNASRSWAEFGANKPILRKVLIFALIIVTLLAIFGGAGPTYAPEYYDAATRLAMEKAKSAMGGKS